MKISKIKPLFHYQLSTSDIIKSELKTKSLFTLNIPSVIFPPKLLENVKKKPSAAFMNLTSEFLVGKYDDKELLSEPTIDKSQPMSESKEELKYYPTVKYNPKTLVSHLS